MSCTRRLAAALLLLAACKGGKAPPGKAGDKCATDGACAAPLVCTAKTCSIPTRHYTFRAIGGVSMGAAGSSRLAAAHPEKFDAAGFLGGPLDAALVLRMLENGYLSGFCSPQALAAALAADQLDGGNRLDRPDGVAGCAEQPNPPPGHYDYPNRFNKWHYTTNGGHFDRDASIDIFSDLMAALGNPLSTSASDPGALPPLTSAQLQLATCESPAVVEHYVDPKYSPHGEYRAITFCDGEPPLVICDDKTLVDWCAAAAAQGRKLAARGDADGFCAAHGGNAHDADETTDADLYYAHHGQLPGCWPGHRKIPFALALDLNGNGRRDYHEPVVYAAHEPFEDVGADRCPDALEDGKGGCTTAELSPFAKGVKDPNGDNYDAVTNPAGTEGNHLWDVGEPFSDTGLDGVAGSGDFGEGDGKYTVAPGMQAWLDGDLRTRLSVMTRAQLKAIDFYLDGGIRDIFDLGAQAEALAGGLSLYSEGGARSFLDFPAIPQLGGQPWPSGRYDPLLMDPAALGHAAFVPYGKPTATPEEQRAGNGDHVGTIEEVYDRFVTFFRWVSARWDPIGKPTVLYGGGTVETVRYASAALGTERDFVVTLPPGYTDPANAAQRYPVLLMLHGYGQTPNDFATTSAFTNVAVNAGLMRELIIAYPDGRCCFRDATGQRVCTEDQGGKPGFVRECQRGSFFVNHAGPAGTHYGDATLEVFDELDKRYRTMPAADGPAY